MNYQVTEKVIPETIVYTSETVLKVYSDMMQWIPAVGEECLSLNPEELILQMKKQIYEDLAEYHVHRIPRMGVDECVTDYPDLLCIVSHSQGCSLPLW